MKCDLILNILVLKVLETKVGKINQLACYQSRFAQKIKTKKGNTRFISSNPNVLCNGLKLLIQEKQAGNNSKLIIEEIGAIVDKLLEYKCISMKQHSTSIELFSKS